MAKVIRCYKPDGTHEDITTTLSIDALRKRLNGYVEVHNVFGLTIACDEEGKLKSLAPCGSIAGMNYVGDVYVGKMGAKGLVPVEPNIMEDFDKKFRRA